jgi:Resolvase, N terminal domain
VLATVVALVAVNQTLVFFIAQVTWRLDRKKPAPKYSDGFLNSGGDVLAVWRLDRLGRSLKHLIELMAELEAERIGFQSVTESIDTTTPGGKNEEGCMGKCPKRPSPSPPAVVGTFPTCVSYLWGARGV